MKRRGRRGTKKKKEKQKKQKKKISSYILSLGWIMGNACGTAQNLDLSRNAVDCSGGKSFSSVLVAWKYTDKHAGAMVSEFVDFAQLRSFSSRAW